MTTVYIVIGSVFAIIFACANPGVRVWWTATKFKLRRQFFPSGPAVASHAAVRSQLPGDHAAADADAEAEAEAAWRRRRAAQTKKKPGRATASTKTGAGGKGSRALGGSGMRAKKGLADEEVEPLDPTS
jgi:hypothetical protein